MIGWYVHHVGRGHQTRAAAIRPYLHSDVVTLTSLPAPADDPDWVMLDRDDSGSSFIDPTADAHTRPTRSSPRVDCGRW